MPTIEDFCRKFKNHVPGPQDNANTYAVLVPLVERGGELYLVFEVRARTMRRQPNEVCFPGGRMESGETECECAVRETMEELGLPRSAIHVIGRMDYIAHYSSIIIYPVLARLEPWAIDEMKPNRAEVEDTFLVPYSFFRENMPALYSYDLVPVIEDEFPYEQVGLQVPYPFSSGKVIMPIYDAYEGRIVWGLTGRIVRWMVQNMERDGREEERV